MNQEELFAALSAAVDSLDGDKTAGLVKSGLDAGIPALDLINKGLTVGLKNLGQRFQREEAFIPELIMGAGIAGQQIDFLKPLLEKGKELSPSKGKFILGTVAGDIHDLGKNLVRLILSTGGWEVIDLGHDVANERFVETVAEQKPVWLGMSSLLTTSMGRQKEVIDMLKERGLRDKVQIMVGGAPCSQYWAEEIGADAYGADPVEAANKAEAVL